MKLKYIFPIALVILINSFYIVDFIDLYQNDALEKPVAQCFILLIMIFVLTNWILFRYISKDIRKNTFKNKKIGFIEMPNGWAKENYKGGKINVNEDNSN